jgi:hypothetical protein
MSGELSYSYKAASFGAPWEFKLRPEGLELSAGRRGGLLRYDQILRVRLSFRPVTMQSYRFQAEIWSKDFPKIRIASTSWRGIVEQVRQDEAYTAFIVELHRRIATAGAPAQFSTGMPGIVYWIGLAVFVAVALGLAALAVRALRLEEWAGAAVVGGFFALFLWQLGGFFRRNRPGVYRPESVPAIVLPRQ